MPSFFISRAASHVTMHPTAIVRGAAGRVPRVEVAADEHDFLGLLAAADLADDVERLDVGLEAGLHLQAQAHADAAVHQPLDAFDASSVGNGGGGNLRDRVVAVVHAAGVRRAQPGGPTERTSAATAPCREAARAPPER